MPFKPFEIKMTEQQVIDGLKSTFGNEFTTPDVRAFCAMNDISYNTVTRKIKKFRIKPGKWSLKVTSKRVRQIETKALEKLKRSLLEISNQNKEFFI